MDIRLVIAGSALGMAVVLMLPANLKVAVAIWLLLFTAMLFVGWYCVDNPVDDPDDSSGL